MLRWLILIATHAAMLGVGFAAGIYALPILTAPKGPDAALLKAASTSALFKGRFERNLQGSDFLHWGEGDVTVMRDKIAHAGRLAPGPDYKLYLTRDFVDTKDGFIRIKSASRLVGDVKTFSGFIVDLPPGVDVAQFTTVVVWCEAFSQFITAARYR
jgi:hypothetical protein